MELPEENASSKKPRPGTTGEGQKPDENPGLDKVSKNPNPAANANLNDEEVREGDADDVGSEVTDGEDG